MPEGKPSGIKCPNCHEYRLMEGPIDFESAHTFDASLAYGLSLLILLNNIQMHIHKHSYMLYDYSGDKNGQIEGR